MGSLTKGAGTDRGAATASGTGGRGVGGGGTARLVRWMAASAESSASMIASRSRITALPSLPTTVWGPNVTSRRPSLGVNHSPAISWLPISGTSIARERTSSSLVYAVSFVHVVSFVHAVSFVYAVSFVQDVPVADPGPVRS